MRMRWPCTADQPRALLGVGHIHAGELIPDRLLSPLEIQQILEGTSRPHERGLWNLENTMSKQIRNIAIIAHVDHGKTTMVDQLLRHSGHLRRPRKVVDTVMDNHAIERERGITILAKNCAVRWKDTAHQHPRHPGHADFGGEVERALSMVDGVVLLIDCARRPHAANALCDQKGAGPGAANPSWW